MVAQDALDGAEGGAAPEDDPRGDLESRLTASIALARAALARAEARGPAGAAAARAARSKLDKLTAARTRVVMERVAREREEQAGTAADPAAPPPAGPARLHRRHRGVMLSFALGVLLPMLVASWYLWGRATDQYASFVSFSVRSGDARSGGDFLGRLGQFAGTNSTDTDILYQFLQSQELVAKIDGAVDLERLYSAPYDRDPVFALAPGGTIEDLTEYWGRIVRISYDSGSGLMELRVLAFDPAVAQDIATRLLDESTRRINELSQAARTDTTRYAQEELAKAQAQLRTAREAVTAFRSRVQIVDPDADIRGQTGLLTNLQGQLAEALIELDLLHDTASEGDPRIAQLERRIEAIRKRIAEERSRISTGGAGPGGEDYATVVAEFERLTAEREFAEAAYANALTAFNAAQAEANRTSRYLAAHVLPTRAESARYPDRPVILALTGLFLLLAWTVGVLVYYSIRDRR